MVVISSRVERVRSSAVAHPGESIDFTRLAICTGYRDCVNRNDRIGHVGALTGVCQRFRHRKDGFAMVLRKIRVLIDVVSIVQL
jgi:hypothetical protein